MDYKLHKDEKLCSRTAINTLFEEGKSLMAFPLRAAYRLRPAGNHPVQFLISIPKKRIHKAVGRVLLRRRIREAYRLNKQILLDALTPVTPSTLHPSPSTLCIAFIWQADELYPTSVVEDRMKTLLHRIAEKI